MFTEPFMGLTVWNLLTDLYDHNAQANNLVAIGQHDHSTGKGTQIGSGGIANGAIIGAKIAAATIPQSALAFITPTLLEGVFASRPVAGTFGRLYYVTDSGTLQFDNGQAWSSVVLTGSGVGALSTLNVSVDTVMVVGTLYQANTAGMNMTLPSVASVSGSKVLGVMAGATATGPAPITITPNGSDRIFGVGSKTVGTNIVLGTPGSFVILQSNSGSASWMIVGGQQDSGVIPLISTLAGVTGGSARLAGNRVYLSGSLVNSSGSSVGSGVDIAALPTATMFPKAVRQVTTLALGGALPIPLTIDTAGFLTINIAFGNGVTLSLDGVSFDPQLA